MKGGRWLGASGVLLVVLHPFLGGCAVRVTARTARWHEEGREPGPARPGTPPLEDLALEADRLRGPQRDVVQAALASTGEPSSGLDCSSLVVRAYAAAGLEVPRTVEQQLLAGRAVAPGELCPGDLVFFAFGARRANHVGIYTGRGTFVHVSRVARCVRLESLAESTFAGTRVAARRLLAEPLP